VQVPRKAQRIGGTSANLQENDELRLVDLLYGLMLPSGNDCAIALASYFGKFYHESLPVVGFVKVMNYMCSFINLNDTFFQNPHGMSTRPNISTAQDVALMAAYAMENRTFRLIVASKQHYCEISNPEGGVREVLWVNTNRLLDCGFDGVKTGTTGKAGPCVCVRVKSEDCPLIVTVLNSQTSEDRWNDAVLLAEWGKAGQGQGK
jgi:D-alanyl-D-alanine carboxypeptidase (penicillin-binding protein 5/6)